MVNVAMTQYQEIELSKIETQDLCIPEENLLASAKIIEYFHALAVSKNLDHKDIPCSAQS